MSAAPTRSDFAESVGSAFTLQAPDGPLEVKLATFRDIELSDRVDCFSVLFEGTPDPILPQGTYQMEREGVGEFAIFLVPITRDEQHVTYEAVFNRLIDAGTASGEAT